MAGQFEFRIHRLKRRRCLWQRPVFLLRLISPTRFGPVSVFWIGFGLLR